MLSIATSFSHHQVACDVDGGEDRVDDSRALPFDYDIEEHNMLVEAMNVLTIEEATELVWSQVRTYMKGKGEFRATELFKEMDKDQSGKIDVDEFMSALLRMEILGVDKNLATALIQQIDPNGDGLLEYNEILPMLKLQELREAQETEEPPNNPSAEEAAVRMSVEDAVREARASADAEGLELVAAVEADGVIAVAEAESRSRETAAAHAAAAVAAAQAKAEADAEAAVALAAAEAEAAALAAEVSRLAAEAEAAAAAEAKRVEEARAVEEAKIAAAAAAAAEALAAARDEASRAKLAAEVEAAAEEARQVARREEAAAAEAARVKAAADAVAAAEAARIVAAAEVEAAKEGARIKAAAQFEASVAAARVQAEADAALAASEAKAAAEKEAAARLAQARADAEKEAAAAVEAARAAAEADVAAQAAARAAAASEQAALVRQASVQEEQEAQVSLQEAEALVEPITDAMVEALRHAVLMRDRPTVDAAVLAATSPPYAIPKGSTKLRPHSLLNVAMELASRLAAEDECLAALKKALTQLAPASDNDQARQMALEKALEPLKHEQPLAGFEHEVVTAARAALERCEKRQAIFASMPGAITNGDGAALYEALSNLATMAKAEDAAAAEELGVAAKNAALDEAEAKALAALKKAQSKAEASLKDTLTNDSEDPLGFEARLAAAMATARACGLVAAEEYDPPQRAKPSAVVTAAQERTQRFLEENGALKSLNQAIANRNKLALIEAINACKALTNFEPGALQVAQEIVQSLSVEDDALKAMRKAMLSAKAGLYSENAPALRESVAKAQGALGPASPPQTTKYIAQAEDLLAKIDAEDALILALSEAFAHSDGETIEAALLNIEHRPAGPERLEPAKSGVGPNKATQLAVESAKQVLAHVYAASNLTNALAKATAGRDKVGIDVALDAIAEHAAAVEETTRAAAQRKKTSLLDGSSADDDVSQPLEVNQYALANQDTVALAKEVLKQMAAEAVGFGLLQAAQEKRSSELLEEAMESVRSQGLEETSNRVADALTVAEELHIQINKEAEAVREVQSAMDSQDRDALQKALDRAKNVFEEGGESGIEAYEDSSVMAQAQLQFEKNTTEKELVISVAMAIGKQDRALLAATLDKASNGGHQHPTLSQAAQLRKALDDSFGVLEAAMEARDGQKLFKALRDLKKNQLAPFDPKAVQAAQQVLAELEHEARVLHALAQATTKGDLPSLIAALAQVDEQKPLDDDGELFGTAVDSSAGGSASGGTSASSKAAYLALAENPATVLARAMVTHINALEDALKAGNATALRAAVDAAAASECGHGLAYETALSRLGSQEKLEQDLAICLRDSDVSGLRAALAKAHATEFVKLHRLQKASEEASSALLACDQALEAGGTEAEVADAENALLEAQAAAEKASQAASEADAAMPSYRSATGYEAASKLLDLAEELHESLAAAVMEVTSTESEAPAQDRAEVLNQVLEETKEKLPSYRECDALLAEASLSLADAVGKQDQGQLTSAEALAKEAAAAAERHTQADLTAQLAWLETVNEVEIEAAEKAWAKGAASMLEHGKSVASLAEAVYGQAQAAAHFKQQLGAETTAVVALLEAITERHPDALNEALAAATALGLEAIENSPKLKQAMQDAEALLGTVGFEDAVLTPLKAAIAHAKKTSDTGSIEPLLAMLAERFPEQANSEEEDDADPVIVEARELVALTAPQRQVIATLQDVMQRRDNADGALVDAIAALKAMRDEPRSADGNNSSSQQTPRLQLITRTLNTQVNQLLLDAEALVDALAHEGDIVKTLQSAMVMKDRQALDFALEEAEGHRPTLDPALLAEANQLLAAISSQEDVVADLKDALATGEPGKMRQGLATARAFGTPVRDAEELARLVADTEAVLTAVENLKLATETQAEAWKRELGPVLEARDAFLQLNMPSASGGALLAATELIEALELETEARAAIDAAVAERSIEALEVALAEAEPPHVKNALSTLAVHSGAVRGAATLLRRLKKEAKVVTLLGDALAAEARRDLVVFALKEAESMEGGPLEHPAVARAQARLTRTDDEANALSTLKACIDSMAEWAPPSPSPSKSNNKGNDSSDSKAKDLASHLDLSHRAKALSAAVSVCRRFDDPPFCPVDLLLAERLLAVADATVNLSGVDDDVDHVTAGLSSDEVGDAEADTAAAETQAQAVLQSYSDSKPSSASTFVGLGAEGRPLLDPEKRSNLLTDALTEAEVSPEVAARLANELGVSELLDLKLCDDEELLACGLSAEQIKQLRVASGSGDYNGWSSSNVDSVRPIIDGQSMEMAQARAERVLKEALVSHPTGVSRAEAAAKFALQDGGDTAAAAAVPAAASSTTKATSATAAAVDEVSEPIAAPTPASVSALMADRHDLQRNERDDANLSRAGLSLTRLVGLAHTTTEANSEAHSSSSSSGSSQNHFDLLATPILPYARQLHLPQPAKASLALAGVGAVGVQDLAFVAEDDLAKTQSFKAALKLRNTNYNNSGGGDGSGSGGGGATDNAENEGADQGLEPAPQYSAPWALPLAHSDLLRLQGSDAWSNAASQQARHYRLLACSALEASLDPNACPPPTRVPIQGRPGEFNVVQLAPVVLKQAFQGQGKFASLCSHGERLAASAQAEHAATVDLATALANREDSGALATALTALEKFIGPASPSSDNSSESGSDGVGRRRAFAKHEFGFASQAKLLASRASSTLQLLASAKRALEAADLALLEAVVAEAEASSAHLQLGFKLVGDAGKRDTMRRRKQRQKQTMKMLRRESMAGNEEEEDDEEGEEKDSEAKSDLPVGEGAPKKKNKEAPVSESEDEEDDDDEDDDDEEDGFAAFVEANVDGQWPELMEVVRAAVAWRTMVSAQQHKSVEGVRTAVDAAAETPGVSPAAVAKGQEFALALEANLDWLSHGSRLWGGVSEATDELEGDLRFVERNLMGSNVEGAARIADPAADLAKRKAAATAAHTEELEKLTSAMTELSESAGEVTAQLESSTAGVNRVSEAVREREATTKGLEELHESLMRGLADSETSNEASRLERVEDAARALQNAKDDAEDQAPEAERMAKELAWTEAEIDRLSGGVNQGAEARNALAQETKKVEAEWMVLIGQVDEKLTAIKPLEADEAASRALIDEANAAVAAAQEAQDSVRTELNLSEEAVAEATAKEANLQARCRNELRPKIRNLEQELEELEEELDWLRQEYQNFACGLFYKCMGPMQGDSDDQHYDELTMMGPDDDDDMQDENEDTAARKARLARRQLRQERARLGALLGLPSDNSKAPTNGWSVGAAPGTVPVNHPQSGGPLPDGSIPPPAPRPLGSSGRTRRRQKAGVYERATGAVQPLFEAMGINKGTDAGAAGATSSGDASSRAPEMDASPPPYQREADKQGARDQAALKVQQLLRAKNARTAVAKQREAYWARELANDLAQEEEEEKKKEEKKDEDDEDEVDGELEDAGTSLAPVEREEQLAEIEAAERAALEAAAEANDAKASANALLNEAISNAKATVSSADLNSSNLGVDRNGGGDVDGGRFARESELSDGFAEGPEVEGGADDGRHDRESVLEHEFMLARGHLDDSEVDGEGVREDAQEQIGVASGGTAADGAPDSANEPASEAEQDNESEAAAPAPPPLTKRIPATEVRQSRQDAQAKALAAAEIALAEAAEIEAKEAEEAAAEAQEQQAAAAAETATIAVAEERQRTSAQQSKSLAAVELAMSEAADVLQEEDNDDEAAAVAAAEAEAKAEADFEAADAEMTARIASEKQVKSDEVAATLRAMEEKDNYVPDSPTQPPSLNPKRNWTDDDVGADEAGNTGSLGRESPGPMDDGEGRAGEVASKIGVPTNDAMAKLSLEAKAQERSRLLKEDPAALMASLLDSESEVGDSASDTEDF
jgi:Ca2+-binding EF-hand superfamily protein